MNFIQQLVNGIVLGHAYAVIAIGWTLLLGVAKLVNFGHGQMYMVGAFITWWAMFFLGVPYIVAIGIAILVGIVLGLIMQRVMLKATFEQNLVSIMVMTLGWGYILHGAAALIFGSTGKILDTPLSMLDVPIDDLWLTWQDVMIVIVTIVFFLSLQFVLNKTKSGRLVRMVAEDPKLSQLAGISVKNIYYAVFAFEGASVALAAAIVAPRTPILTSMGFDEVIMTFVVVVFGGIGSIKGSYFAGLAIGIFSALFGAYVAPAYSTVAAFTLLIILLVIRPEGLGSNSGSGVY